MCADACANDQLTKHSAHEYEGVVDKFCSRHCAGVHHHLVRSIPSPVEGTRAFVAEAAHTPRPVAIKAAPAATKVVLSI